jgi:hypothetical protein
LNPANFDIEVDADRAIRWVDAEPAFRAWRDGLSDDLHLHTGGVVHRGCL